MIAIGESVSLPVNLHEYEAAARDLLPPMVVDGPFSFSAPTTSVSPVASIAIELPKLISACVLEDLM